LLKKREERGESSQDPDENLEELTNEKDEGRLSPGGKKEVLEEVQIYTPEKNIHRGRRKKAEKGGGDYLSQPRAKVGQTEGKN